MSMRKIIEYAFFFSLVAIVLYVLWQMIAPFAPALALAGIIVTICYPVYEYILDKVPGRHETIAALLSTAFVVLVVFIPVMLIVSTVVNEAVTIYNATSTTQSAWSGNLKEIQTQINAYIPTGEVDTADIVKQASGWLAGNLGAIFAGTASVVFLFFISIIASFFLFRDGKIFTKNAIHISPLPDDQDEVILARMAVAVRSVVTGTITIAFIQGTLTSFGLWLFGFDQFVLWGMVAAIGALVPGIGTSIVFIPAIITLILSGTYASAIGLAIWAMLAVGLIDNLLGPYLMSRGNHLHPFIILLSVLGGISVFGPIGFVVGPVIVSLLKVLLELLASKIMTNGN